MNLPNPESVTRRSFVRMAVGSVCGAAITTGVSASVTAKGGESDTLAAAMYVGSDDEFDAGPPLSGELFDVSSPKQTGNGRIIHHELPFAHGKPYILKHEGKGRYTQRGATINFEGPSDLWPSPGRWRAVVREDVQANDDGAFAWSVTRVDFFKRPRMVYDQSIIIVVWDENEVDYPNQQITEVIDKWKAIGRANPGGR